MSTLEKNFIPSAKEKQEQTSLPTDGDIRVMPADFFPKVPPASSSFPWTLIVVIVVLILTLGGVGAYIVFFSSSEAPASPGIPSPSSSTSTPPPDTGSAQATTTPPVRIPSGSSATSTPAQGSVGPSNLFPRVFVRARDSDLDNLTDEEERLFNTDPSDRDSDKDGYTDGQETENLYDPLAPNPALLEQSISIRMYESEIFGYRFLYPSAWAARPLDEKDPRELWVNSGIAGEALQVIVQENTKQQSAFSWYLEQLGPGADASVLLPYQHENLQGVWSTDGKTVYMTPEFGGSQQYIYSMTYMSDEGKEVHFPTVFRMMLRSFRVFAPKNPIPSFPPADAQGESNETEGASP